MFIHCVAYTAVPYSDNNKAPLPAAPARHTEQAGNSIYERKSLLTRAIEVCQRVPVKGILSQYQRNCVTACANISPADIDPQTTIVTLNNKHSGLLIGGHTHDDDSLASHVLLWASAPPTTEKLFESIKKYGPPGLAAQVLCFIAAYCLPQLGLLNPIMPFATTVAIFGLLEMTPLKPISALIHLSDRKGYSLSQIHRSTFHPTALTGLDVQAMITKANEIKRAAHYNIYTNNCATVVYAVIKAGVPGQLHPRLPPEPYVITPQGVADLVDFLVANQFVQLGEVDDDGVAWFEAQSDMPWAACATADCSLSAPEQT